MARVDKSNTNAVFPTASSDSDEGRAETAYDLPTSGIPGTNEEMAMMLGRDGKVLSGRHLPCYATGRTDRAAPEFPGVSGNLRGVAKR